MNIRSLPKHKAIFQELLLEEDIHFFALNETRIPKATPLYIPRYSLLHTPGPTTAQRLCGGVALGIKPKFPYRTNILPPQFPYQEYSIATLYLKSINVTLATVYIRPTSPLPTDFFLYIASTYRHYFILAN